MGTVSSFVIETHLSGKCKKLPLRGKTSPGRDRFSPRRGEMSLQVTKRGTDVAQRQKGESGNAAGID